MSRTNWDLMVRDKERNSTKNKRKKIYVTEKILAADLPAYIDNGWEKSKDFKTAKYVGVTKEKPVGEQFEDKLWVLFADMGFPELNGVCDFEISYE